MCKKTDTTDSDKMELQNKVLYIHSKCLQIIVRGIDKDGDNYDNKANNDSKK